MNPSSRVGSAFVWSLVVGTALQLTMVTVGHWVTAVANLFGALGITISFAAGWLFVRWASGLDPTGALLGGAGVGGLCALLGIVVSYLLGDVTALILALGTLSSVVTGALGGIVAFRRQAQSAAG